MSTVASARRGYDAALAGADCYVLGIARRPTPLPSHRWQGTATADDHRLLDLCRGATLDIGCGPGRMGAALLRRGLPVLGVDVSAVAVALTRARGMPALVRNVFDPVPGAGRWRCALLADGNIGIGGDPVALLTRTAQLLAPGGTVVVDLAPPGVAARTRRLRLLVERRRTSAFWWSTVGVDAIGPLASRAGFAVDCVADLDGRWCARLRRQETPRC